MKKSIKRNIASAGLAFGLAIAMAVPVTMAPTIFGETEAFAQVQSRPKRRPPALRNVVFERLSKTQETADAGDIRQAVADAQKILTGRDLNSHEIAVVHRYLFGYYYELEDEKTAIEHLKLALAQENIPYSFEDSIRFALAQLYTATDQFDLALRELNTWFSYQPNPLPNAYYLRAQLSYQMAIKADKAGNKTEARKHFMNGVADVEQAIDMAEQSEVGIGRESWYSLLAAMYYSLENFTKVTEILEFLIIRWPRPQYWSQLGAMYSLMEEEEKQLAVMDVGYRLGFLEKESNIVNMAQLYSFHGTPFLGAKVLLEGMEKTKVDDEGETVPLVDKSPENYKTLGQALLQSRDYADAAPYLEIAAEAEEDGELYIQLGQIYSTLEDWENTAQAMQNAIDKGDLRREDQAYLYLGQAYFNMTRFEQAERAFQQARKDERSRKTVQGWLKFITYEKGRLRRLAAAGLR